MMFFAIVVNWGYKLTIQPLVCVYLGLPLLAYFSYFCIWWPPFISRLGLHVFGCLLTVEMNRNFPWKDVVKFEVMAQFLWRKSRNRNLRSVSWILLFISVAVHLCFENTLQSYSFISLEWFTDADSTWRRHAAKSMKPVWLHHAVLVYSGPQDKVFWKCLFFFFIIWN